MRPRPGAASTTPRRAASFFSPDGVIAHDLRPALASRRDGHHDAAMNPPSWRPAALAALAAVALLPVSAAPAAAPADESPSGYELALVDLRGKRTILATLPPTVFAPRVSPDGRQVAYELADAAPAAGSTPLYRLRVAPLNAPDQAHALPPVGSGRNYAPVWSTDGRQLAFAVAADGQPDAIYVRRADGSDAARHVVDGRAAEAFIDDDRGMLFLLRGGEGDYDIARLDLATGRVTPMVVRPDTAQHSSRQSPDGRWLAYASTETGRQEVWLEPLPQTGQRFRVTQDGGRHPLWSPDGRTLYFDRGDRLYRVEVFTGAAVPKVGRSRALPIEGFQQGELRRQYDLMPDGRGFLMLFPVHAARH
jgi:dipeptidyl aminopeptidase/acylaminoacyl peptidase